MLLGDACCVNSRPKGWGSSTMAIPSTQQAAVEAASEPKPQPADRSSPEAAKEVQPGSEQPADELGGQTAAQLAKDAAEVSRPAAAAPAQPSTPSADSKEPAGRSSRGSGGDEMEAAAQELAVQPLPAPTLQPPAPRPGAGRPKSGRGCRAAALAAQPQRARSSRASAVAAAGFLAKVINAEANGAEVSTSGRCPCCSLPTLHIGIACQRSSHVTCMMQSCGGCGLAISPRGVAFKSGVHSMQAPQDDDLGYQAGFRRAAKRKPAELKVSSSRNMLGNMLAAGTTAW